MRFWVKAVVGLAVVGGAAAVAFPFATAYWKQRSKVDYRQAAIVRGEIVLVVNSTGTIQPVRRVQVGSFVSGPIEKLNVDFNTVVKKGDVLAKIDERLYKANVARDEATCATARAQVTNVKAQLQQAANDEQRAKALRATNRTYISDTEMDKFKFSRISLEAQLAVAEASVKQAEGGLENSRANLAYTEIVSPVDGIVIDRKIDQGQTLAAQFQTPELFVVAPEMDKRMQVFASVDEADIGLIQQAKKSNQPVLFTVDAHPDDLFHGSIYQIRVNPTTTQNVVTYTVVVDAPNPERKLLPGMTANLSFQIEKRDKILKVPNAALRFYPKPEQVRPEDRKLVDGSVEETPEEQEKTVEVRRSAMERAEAGKKRRQRHVWVTEEAGLRAIEVTTGLSDSSFSEVLVGSVKEGQEVVTGVRVKRS